MQTQTSRRWQTWALLPAIVLSLLVTFVCRSASAADKASAVYVVAIDSDDATEDHADAFTAILKNRLRSTPGWQLVESSATLATLGPSLRCPKVPDPPCLQRIGDQLKTDRFFWGKLTSGPGAHIVTAEVHLWVRSKPEQVVKETFSDNLKDQNDDALKKVVNHVFDKLAGVSSDGVVNVKANVEEGNILVDGKPQGKLDRGNATLSLSAGSHTITVESMQGTASWTSGALPVTVVAGGEVSLAVELKPGAIITPISTEPPGKPAPVQKIVGGAVMGVGAVLGIVGIVEGVMFLSKRSQNQTDHDTIVTNGRDFCAIDSAEGAKACENIKSAETARTLWYVLGGAGLALVTVGTIVFATAPSNHEAPKASLRVLPAIGPTGGGVDVSLTF